MQKINFVNNSSPDLDANTLNQMQTNIENAINKLDYDLIEEYNGQDYITLQNSADSVLKSININGNDEQDGTPTPDNPVPVKVVGDNINIFQIPDSETKNGITYIKHSDGTFSLKGTATQNTTFSILVEDYPIKNGESYILHSNFTGYNSGLSCRVEDYQDNTWKKVLMILYSNAISQQAIYNPLQDKEGNNIRFTIQIDANITINKEDCYIKLERGTIATPYSPYGMGSMNLIAQNRNLYKKENTITGDTNEQGQITGNSKSEISNFIKVYPNFNYNFNGISTPQETNIKRVHYYDKNKNWIKQGAFLSVNANVSFNIPFKTDENTAYIRISHYKDDKNVQINEGTQVAQYILGQEQNKLMYIQKPMLTGDYFDWESEEEVHIWKKLVFNGTENWIRAQNDNETVRFGITITTAKFAKWNLWDAPNWKCNYFTPISFDDVYAGNSTGISWWWNDTIQQIIILFQDNRTLEEFKTWLQNNNVVVYYKLAETERLPFTEEQKMQAQELKKTKTYEEVTHVSISDEMALVNGEYYLNNRYNNQYAKQTDIANLYNEIKLLKESIEN